MCSATIGCNFFIELSLSLSLSLLFGFILVPLTILGSDDVNSKEVHKWKSYIHMYCLDNDLDKILNIDE
jgi:hypothetical protein